MAKEGKIKNPWSVVEGIVWLLLMGAMLVWVLSGCTSNANGYEYKGTEYQTTSTQPEKKQPKRRTIFDDRLLVLIENDNGISVYCHPETRVCYLVNYEGGITPLFNPDGSLFIYNE